MKLFDSALWQRCTLCVNGPGQCVEIQSSKKTSANVSMQKIKCVCVCVHVWLIVAVVWVDIRVNTAEKKIGWLTSAFKAILSEHLCLNVGSHELKITALSYGSSTVGVELYCYLKQNHFD